MRSTEDRLLMMHARAEEIKRRREQTGMRIVKALSGGLTVCLVFVMYKVMETHHALISGQGAGSSLLSESAGGYVLVAVAAFFIGAIITALAIHYRKHKGKDRSGID